MFWFVNRTSDPRKMEPLGTQITKKLLMTWKIDVHILKLRRQAVSLLHTNWEFNTFGWWSSVYTILLPLWSQNPHGKTVGFIFKINGTLLPFVNLNTKSCSIISSSFTTHLTNTSICHLLSFFCVLASTTNQMVRHLGSLKVIKHVIHPRNYLDNKTTDFVP